jgi:uncharacterized membrane protein YedE/YeeE
MAEGSFAAALAGVALIGAAAVLLMLFVGRIAGVSGIAARLLPPFAEGELAVREFAGRAAFVVGLVAAPAAWRLRADTMPDLVVDAGPATLVVAGLLVGFGSVLGSGCTSGHGVCGLSRLSKRSYVAVAIFMATAIATAVSGRHFL